MPLLSEVEWEEPPLIGLQRDRELEQWCKRRIGFNPPSTGYFAGCPPVMRMSWELALAPLLHVDEELGGLVELAVSQTNACRFCYAGTRFFMGLSGVSEERIEQLEEALQARRGDARLEPAMDFARRISRANPPPSAPERKALTEAGYGDAVIKELAFAAGRMEVANRMSSLLALPAQRAERYAYGRIQRLLRPLLRWRVGDYLGRTGQPEFLEGEMKRGPFAYLVLALDGLPAAGALRRALDEIWSAPHTSRRAKALVFAVVARGLGCRRAEAEAFGLLEEEGLGAARVEQILADLAGPELDAVESAFVPYARETLWYEPAPIQRRGRALLDRLTGEQFLELLGVASLANMVGRLAVVLDEP